MARDGISSYFKFDKIAELPGAESHHFVKILDRGLKARTPNLNKSLRFQGLPFLDPISLLGYWICS